MQTDQDVVRERAGMFNRIASHYDFLNRLFSFRIDSRWRKKVAAVIDKNKEAEVLDVATGTGDLAITIGRKTNAIITGVDISEKMLALGIKKVEKSGLKERIFLQSGQAEALYFGNNHFDFVTIGFGLRNVANLKNALSEFNRVLKPGGKLIILEFSKPDNNLFGRLFVFYFKKFMPWLGGIVSGDRKAYHYLHQSVESFPYGQELCSIILEHNFTGCTIHKLTSGIASIYVASKPPVNQC